ncbi:MAG: radical SAM protein [Chitinispirillaceae bacterium]
MNTKPLDNFGWMATWKITDRCNLRCTYCDPSIMKRANAPEKVDRFTVLEKIRSFNPRILNISGGEPTLVRELPDLLRIAKETWDPFIRVVHNGTGIMKLRETFPYLDRVVISIDGPGEINRSTRGLSGDTVLERIKEVLPFVENGPELIINTVVTEKNIGSLPRFASQISTVSPKVVLALLPVTPPDSELSLLSSPGGYERFLKVYYKMLSFHPLVIHNFDCMTRQKNFRIIQCYNQYFALRFSPRGELFTCGMDLGAQLRSTRKPIHKLFKKGGFSKALTLVSRQLKKSRGKVDFTCRNICNCDSWLDMLFLGKDTGYAPFALRGFKGRLSDEDYRSLDSFVSRHINSDFDVNQFRKRVEET